MSKQAFNASTIPQVNNMGDGTHVPVVELQATTIDTATAQIAHNASISGDLNLGGKGIIRLVMPSVWTAAVITFQVSHTGAGFKDLYKADGTEYSITVAADRSIILPPSDFAGFNYIRLRSGTAAAAVAQLPGVGLTRDIVLVVRPL